MRSWHNDLIEWATRVDSQSELLRKACQLAQAMDFEWCAYHVQAPLPISCPITEFANNYPIAWQSRYQAKEYLKIDPVVKKAKLTRLPFLWDSSLAQTEPVFWEEVRQAGLNIGWTCSNLCPSSTFSMLSLNRRNDPITQLELAEKELKMRWLADATHAALSRLFEPKDIQRCCSLLTDREIEVLRWTADGKTQCEISQILSISSETVKFHSRNAIAKLGATNKTAAVVRASMLGVLTS